MIGLDTNVLVRYLVEDDAAQASKAARLIETRCTEDAPGFVNRVVLCELVWVLESANDYPRATVAATLESLLRTAELEVDAADAAWPALTTYRGGGVDFAGAYPDPEAFHGRSFRRIIDQEDPPDWRDEIYAAHEALTGR